MTPFKSMNAINNNSTKRKYDIKPDVVDKQVCGFAPKWFGFITE